MRDNRENFSNLIFNPIEADKVEFDAAMELSLGDIFIGHDHLPKLKKQKILSYIILMYDKNSIIRRNIRDIQKRKQKCATLAGYDLSKERDKKEAEELYELSNEIVRQVLLSFIIYQQSAIWSQLITAEQLFWQLQRDIVMDHQDFSSDKQRVDYLKGKSGLIEESDKLISKIEAYEERLFGGDTEALDASNEIRAVKPETFIQHVHKSPKRN